MNREKKTCEWAYSEDEDAWTTGCGEMFTIYEGTPAENNMLFCFHCGKPLKECK
jgi:hypothetical protein